MRPVDAPRYRVIPPLAIGAPMLAGWALSMVAGDPLALPRWTRWPGAAFLLAFAFLNGPTYLRMLREGTGILPRQPATTLLTTGVFRYSRNPLYVGLLALHVGLALWMGSTWMLLLAPVSLALLHWGAVLPEEEYLRGKFGARYERYRETTRRWLGSRRR